jgi:hypothetical protein
VKVGEPEAATNQPAIAEKALYLARSGVGDHVEILGLTPEKQVAYAPSHKIGGKPLFLQAVKGLYGIGAKAFAGNGVIRPRYDEGSILVH